MAKEMTPDTKRAIEILQPLADELEVEVSADNRFLHMDDQMIGIECNSTYATLMEMIGWIFLERYDRDFRAIDIDFQELQDTICRYWVREDLLNKIKED